MKDDYLLLKIKRSNMNRDDILISFPILLSFFRNKSHDDICVGSYLILVSLFLNESHSIKELKSLLSISDTKLYLIIYRLTQRGYINDSFDAHDQRKRLLKLSNKGKEYLNLITSVNR